MTRPRIAIATCAGYDDLKAGDAMLREALAARGAEARSVVWDGPDPGWEGFDLCLVRSTWDYHDKHAEFLAWARRVEEATVLRNPAELIAWNSEKTYLRELERAGVPTVPTVWISRGDEVDVETVLAQRGWAEAVIKPVVDLGAKNLHRVGAGADEAEAALAAVLARSEAMVQPFLPSLEAEGERSLIYIGGELSHAVRKRPAQGDFRVQSIWGGTAAPTEPTANEIAIGSLSLSQLDEPPLYARVDLVTGPDGAPRLIELELIEPNLYLSTHQTAAHHLANTVISILS
jgi:glutathione synthase/RimK-type ligase-like ATP-grasp enzyme